MMGVELASNDLPIFVVEDGYLSDSEAFASVIRVLDGVRTASVLVAQSDRDQYDYLLSIVDPGKRMGPDEEALLATALKALSGAVSKIDIVYHGSLISNIFGLCLWNYGLNARNALLELITSLAAVPDKFLDGCLHMLVNNFLPPRRLRESISQSRWITRKKEVHSELHMALHYIADVVPLAPMKLKSIIEKRMPRCTDPKDMIVLYVECMLGLENDEIGEFLGSTLLAKVVDLLTDLDVNITWEDILQEEHNKGIFEMELEEWEDNMGHDAEVGVKPPMENGVLKGNAFADKLDGLMVIVCEHLKSRAVNGHLLKVFEALSEIFRSAMLKLHKSKFAQFLMFYACSLDPDICGLKFAVLLTDIFVSKNEDPDSRMKAVAYLASYLARAKFISSSMVASILKRLVDWCFEYCQAQDNQGKINPQAHRVFYSGCQAAMYILCFRMRSILDVPHLKHLLFHMPLGSILCHPTLDPLKICLPSIVQEFLRQAKAARLFKTSVPYLYDNSLESEFSKAFGGIERLDMFFPFDPYLLKESDRFMRPNFEFWSMVKTTYSNCNSEDEYEFDDLDAPDFPENAGTYEEHEDLDLDHGDDLEYSLNKMSITPKSAFQHPINTNFHQPSRMPARIRPSVSPNW
ncbi:hypothetical protein OPV22_010797 [Ensete ventricosum]|uniref:RNA polymerase I-specific transcription initiation factor RRN3 n=1 Tax=Ensete ventricosum TaxID=4639 RepID=A0AAV8PVH5_ENSVE|nr:hypothetical protein OPV22_010797 [Ensete ventricosum]